MHYRKLGTTGLSVSALAFGTWQLGGKRWKPLDDADSVALLRHAREAGINLFDVSAVYGQYRDGCSVPHSRAQELVGKAFAGRTDEIVLNMKIGHLDEYTHRVDFDPRRLVEQFEQSLRRLGTDRVEICLLHAPTLAVIERGRALAVLETLRAQGRVGAIGYALEDEPDHLLAAAEQDIDVVELQYNLLAPAVRPALDAARRHGIGILASGAFKRGYLSGRFRTPDDLPREDDYWDYYLRYSRPMIERTLREATRLLDHHGSPEALRRAALGFVLDQPAITSVVVGFRGTEEITENIAHVDAVLGGGAPEPATRGTAAPLEHGPDGAPEAVVDLVAAAR